MILKSLFFFFLAALFEVGGGYLVWLWLRDDKSFYLGLLGLIAMAGYGVIASFQPQNFGRVYVSYGGFFVLFALFWAMIFDGFKPDKFDLLGTFFILLGLFIMMFVKR